MKIQKKISIPKINPQDTLNYISDFLRKYNFVIFVVFISVILIIVVLSLERMLTGEDNLFNLNTGQSNNTSVFDQATTQKIDKYKLSTENQSNIDAGSERINPFGD